MLKVEAAALRIADPSSTGLGCIRTKPPGLLGTTLSIYRTALVIIAFWETARLCAVSVDPKDDGFGAKEVVKDAQSSMKIACPGELFVFTEKVVEGNMERRKESGQVSEHDKC